MQGFDTEGAPSILHLVSQLPGYSVEGPSPFLRNGGAASDSGCARIPPSKIGELSPRASL